MSRLSRVVVVGALVGLTVLVLAAFGAAPEVVMLLSVQDRAPKPPPARFVHSEHTALQCFNCHPGVFGLPRPRVDHQAMKQGLYCGACHDGKLATSIKEIGCGGCHAE